ncbi:family 16 glycoside hydrolase [Paenibacillus cymbidii]|uniref:family 16 glycoside hydrolase n=1 Tax=Paenibacillus cymbidii TaxID=1639034 RepID=UPI001F303ED3|nr:family 16 glycoside hydrolase [Paenibacillus cymbidii]
MHPDGSGDTNLTAGYSVNSGNSCYGLSLSVDGSKLIYSSHNGTYAKVVMANADGTSPVVVSTSGQYTYMASANSDGTEIVFSNNSLGYKIQLENVATQTITTLAPALTDTYVPQFTKDDQKIVFTQKYGSSDIYGNIYIVNKDGTGLTNLTNNNLFAYEYFLSSLDTHGASEELSLSPDGTKILYSQYVGSVPQLYTMNMDGSGKTQLTNGETWAAKGKYSPDGTRIGFIRKVGANYWQLFVMNADGSNVRQLTNITGAVRNFDWAPTGEEIYYTDMEWGGGAYDPANSVSGELHRVSVKPDSSLFLDDFEAYSTGAYPPSNWSNPNGNGPWTVENGYSHVLQQSGTGLSQYFFVTAGSSSWTDYEVSARVKPTGNSAGVFGRYQSTNTYYMARIDTSQVALYKIIGGTVTLLASASYPFSTSSWYNIKLSMHGSSLKVYLNGALKLTATDAALSTGRIALYTIPEAAFDYVSVANEMAFYDGFEGSPSPWIARKGTASASTAHAYSGLNSYVTNEDMDVVSHPLGASLNKIVTLQFYDNAGQTTQDSVARADDSGWDGSFWRGLGVITAASSTHYAVRIDGTETATSVPRVTGWHQFKWDYTSGTKVDMYIDGVLVASPTGVTAVSEIAMGDWWADSAVGTYYYDDVKVAD